jgi:hypothetical protein
MDVQSVNRWCLFASSIGLYISLRLLKKRLFTALKQRIMVRLLNIRENGFIYPSIVSGLNLFYYSAEGIDGIPNRISHFILENVLI